MEETKWEEKHQALTHILINPTNNPSLCDQYFISNQIPCYLNWDYPPLLCKNPKFSHLKWGFSLFLRRVFRAKSSWRSKCPYQIPPPLIYAKGVEKVDWSDEGYKSNYARKRFMRKKLYSNVHPFIPVLIPNILVFFLLRWNPFPDDHI